MPFRKSSGVRSIRQRIVGRVTLLMVVHLFVLTGVSAVIGGYQVAGEIDERLTANARELLGRVELRLSFLVERADEFARSSTIINSVIDNAGRNDYLPSVVREYANLDSVASVTVVDFSGAVIESSANSPDWSKLPLSSLLAVSTSSVVATADSGRVLVIAPVSYYNTVQGGVLVELNLGPAIASVTDLHGDEVVNLSVRGKSVFSHRRGDVGLRNVELTAGPELANLRGLEATMSVGVPSSKVMAPVWRSIAQSAMIGGVAVVVAMLLAWRIGSGLAAPIGTLAQRVKRGVHPCGPVGTGDELELLAEAFDSQTKALISSHELLEERVEERTASLARRTAQLQRSNDELDEFAYIASHDLKEPLRGIHNYSIFLLEDYEDKLEQDGVEKLKTLARLCQRMESIIDNLLRFSRLGRVELAYVDTDLNVVVEEIRKDLAINLESNRVELRVPRTLPNLHCDQVRITEVFRNFITNAMKYNDKEKPWIEVGWKLLDGAANADVAAASEVAIYVRDNGIGIREKHQEAIFRIFKRLHGRDKYGGGHGAGLTIVKKIVERHGGRIWLDSKVGEGTTFWFSIGQSGHSAIELKESA